MVVAIAVLVRFATDGGGATDDQGSLDVASSPARNQFQVSFAPTPTPRPTAASYPTRTPTPVSRISSTSTPRQITASQPTAASAPTLAPSAVSGNTAQPTPKPTVAPRPTATPHSTSAPVTTVTATLAPTTVPTPIPVPTAAPQSATEATYFTLGSSQDDVLLAQGTPTKIDRYEASRKEIWHYGWSTVTFSLPDGLVTEWNNDGNLNVGLVSTTPSMTTTVQGGMPGNARRAARRLAWERLARSLDSCVSASHRSSSAGPNRSRGSISRTTR